MRQMSARTLLPVVLVAMTAGLLLLGSSQESKYYSEVSTTTGWELRVVWDYIPPARGYAYLLNFPAAILSLPARAIFGSHSILADAVFLGCVGLLWWWIGLHFDRRLGFLPKRTRSPNVRMLVLMWLGLASSLVFLLAGVNTVAFGNSALGVLPLLGALLWSCLLTVYFGHWLFSYHLRRSRTKPED